MPSTDERARELRRHLPDSAVAAILGVDLEEIAELRLDPDDEIEGAPDDSSGGGETDPAANAVIHYTGDWQQGADYTPGSFGLKVALGSDLRSYLAFGATDPDVNPADIAAAGLAGNWIPFAPLGGGFDFQGAWSAGDYPAGAVVTHGGVTYFAAADTSDEPGISGAPIVDGIQTVWAEPGEINFDTSSGDDTDGTPFQAHADTTILYLPFTHAGHVQLTLDTFDDHYVSYAAYDDGPSLQATGSSDNSIGIDVTSEEWYWVLFHDAGFDSGHDPGPVTATLVLSGGATMTPAPEANPWQAFAAAP